MLLKKINSMNSILRSKENLEGIDFKQILLDSDIVITQTDIKVINEKCVDIEFLIIDSITNETLKIRALGKDKNIEIAQEKAYAYIQKILFSYDKKTLLKKKNTKKEVIIENGIINRKQQKKLFAMASYDTIHSIIEPMGYSSIKDIKTCDFSRILKC